MSWCVPIAALILKLDMVALLIADHPPANSTTIHNMLVCQDRNSCLGGTAYISMDKTYDTESQGGRLQTDPQADGKNVPKFLRAEIAWTWMMTTKPCLTKIDHHAQQVYCFLQFIPLSFVVNFTWRFFTKSRFSKNIPNSVKIHIYPFCFVIVMFENFRIVYKLPRCSCRL